MEFSLQYLPLVILLIPMLTFLVIAFFGKRLPRQGDWFAVSLLFINLA